MKIVTTRGEAGRYIVSAITPTGIRFWEVCKEYNEESERYDGKYWHIYETTGDMYEWYGWGWLTKGRAMAWLKKELQSLEG